MSKPRQELEALLASLGESAQFAATGSLPPVLPGLEVAGVGSIGSPLSGDDAKKLIEKAAQAPFGRGAETIYDTNVRRVWQLEPVAFKLENPAWQGHLEAILAQVTHEFGIKGKVKAELYKLLVYEPGSFFSGHRDTEKVKNMFATLVVCLPSRHEGGTLLVEHDGGTKKIDFDGKEGAFLTQYAAFYADCRHEVLPVTAGYRVCLVYNLCTASRKPEPPQSAAAIERASELLRQIFDADTDAPQKLAIPFLHQYSESGLDPALLKGADRTRAAVLVQAAQKINGVCHIALATQWRSGVPDESGFYYRRGRRGSWRLDESNDVKKRLDWEFVTDEGLSLNHWLDPRGKKVGYGEIGLRKSEILNADSIEGWSFQQEINEDTGNEGASMEQWYRQGAVVIWPRENTFDILAAEGQERALPELEKMVSAAKTDADRETCRKFAATILANWKLTASRRWTEGPITPKGKKSIPNRMLRVLDSLEATELALRFATEVLPLAFDGCEGISLAAICERAGWEPFGPALRALIMPQHPGAAEGLCSVAKLCKCLCTSKSPLSPAGQMACQELAAALAETIRRHDNPPPKNEPNAGFPGGRFGHTYQTEHRGGVVADALRVFATAKDDELLHWFTRHVQDTPTRYDLHLVLIPDVKAMHSWLPEVPLARPAGAELLEYCLTRLRAATAQPVEPPEDMSRPADLHCNCEDCQELASFLRNPQAKTLRYALRKDRREHLHRQIDQYRLDCTHVTERKGSPQTLVCVKTQGDYERRLAQYNGDLKLIAELELLT